MRIGVMTGPERGDTARKADRMQSDVRWAEQAGFQCSRVKGKRKFDPLDP